LPGPTGRGARPKALTWSAMLHFTSQ
jgi:hypothetical protein